MSRIVDLIECVFFYLPHVMSIFMYTVNLLFFPYIIYCHRNMYTCVAM